MALLYNLQGERAYAVGIGVVSVIEACLLSIHWIQCQYEVQRSLEREVLGQESLNTDVVFRQEYQ